MRDMVLGHRTRRACSHDTRRDKKAATDFPRKSLSSMTDILVCISSFPKRPERRQKKAKEQVQGLW
jgi:hypothetical protein